MKLYKKTCNERDSISLSHKLSFCRLSLWGLFLFFICNFLTPEAHAQGIRDSKSSIQLKAGVPGIGLAYRYQATSKVAVRANGTFASIQLNDKYKIKDFQSSNWIRGELFSVGLMGEYSALDWLRLVAGASYVAKAEVGTNLTPTQDFDFGGIEIKEEDAGNLDVRVKYKGLSPYVGLSFGRGLPKKRFNVTVDLGTYYLSRPEVAIVGTKLFKNNIENKELLEENLKDFRWLPVLQVNFNFKI